MSAFTKRPLPAPQVLGLGQLHLARATLRPCGALLADQPLLGKVSASSALLCLRSWILMETDRTTLCSAVPACGKSRPSRPHRNLKVFDMGHWDFHACGYERWSINFLIFNSSDLVLPIEDSNDEVADLEWRVHSVASRQLSWGYMSVKQRSARSARWWRISIPLTSKGRFAATAPQLYISQVLPQRRGWHAGAVGSALAAHFSYYPQREYLVQNTTLLEEYERVAVDACGQEHLVEPDT
jgi:hypothetical protein